MAEFHLLIINWYRRNKRDLPWRNTKNPYFVWLSEIILQQTRVNQGMKYYFKFIEEYPTIETLASADEQHVLSNWQGLGYYSRARNLHATAKDIVSKYNGEFPDTYSDILRLKGVGEYTAAAIGSFCFDLKYAVLDGNVYRVLSRVFDIDLPIDSGKGKKYFSQLAKELLPSNNIDEYNQGIMEFGALHCLPKNPNCISCELNTSCLAFQRKTVDKRPVKKGKIKIRNRYFYYFLFENESDIVLRKRTRNDIWKHLYEFPKMESDNLLNEEKLNQTFQEKYNMIPKKITYAKKHVLSHQRIFPVFISCDMHDFNPDLFEGQEIIISKSDIDNYPIPRMIELFLNNRG